MATPRGAVHRDLEQRLRDMERTVRDLTSSALRRQQLSVSAGDFVVSGGGGVVVQDGGSLRVNHPNGALALRSGVHAGGNGSYGFLVQDPDGVGVIRGYASPDGKSQVYLGHESYNVSHLTAWAETEVTLQSRRLIALTAPALTVTAATHFAGKVDVVGAHTVFGNMVGTEALTVHKDATVRGTLRGAELYATSHPTTSSGANVNMGTAGRIFRVTSSRRYKDNIVDLELDVDAALQLRPRVFTRKDEAHQDEPPRYVGFIAEEADDLGLDGWVEHDEDGKVEGFAYSMWPVAQQVILRRQQDQLDEQAEQLAAQADTIAALTARLEALEAKAG